MTTTQPTYQKITGMAGHYLVTAYIYSGADADLSHYVTGGQTYMGTVSFTTVLQSQTIKY